MSTGGDPIAPTLSPLSISLCLGARVAVKKGPPTRGRRTRRRDVRSICLEAAGKLSAESTSVGDTRFAPAQASPRPGLTQAVVPATKLRVEWL